MNALQKVENYRVAAEARPPFPIPILCMVEQAEHQNRAILGKRVLWRE